jgi:hypothetical protein
MDPPNLSNSNNIPLILILILCWEDIEKATDLTSQYPKTWDIRHGT